MREIKFRFWDNDLKKMFERKPAYNDFCHPNIIPYQFTGLKDKNGTEIYDGDILDFGNKNPVPVIFDNGAFCVFDEPLGWDFDSEEHIIRTDFKYCEVIGNIHQNPELL